MRKELARTPLGKHSHDYVATNVTTGAWVEIIPSLVAPAAAIMIFDSSGRILRVSTGSAGQEEAKDPITGKSYELPMYVVPGGEGVLLPVELKRGTRISLRAVDATANVGYFLINLFG